MNVTWPPAGVGWIIALLVLIVAFLFAVLGQMDWKIAGCLIGLAVARLL